jgi:hypothetical protein
MVDAIEGGFMSKFGPFSKRTLESEQKFKAIFHGRIIANVKKLKVRVLYTPPPNPISLHPCKSSEIPEFAA